MIEAPGARTAGVTDDYLVEIKPSARRTNAAVGHTVNREGTRHAFSDRDAAEAWAGDLSEDDPTVWIRTANPADDAVDGYLMGRTRAGQRPVEVDADPEGRQSAVDAY